MSLITEKQSESDRVRKMIADYLATPESFPVICMRNTLIRQDIKHRERRFTGEQITNFGRFK